VVERVDIYHAYAHLWTVGNAVFGVGTPAAAAWVEPLKDRLSTEGAAPVLAALTALTPPAAAAAEAVRLALGYCATHAARMAYPRFAARQFPIGSGAVERACKSRIEQRATQAGMRWRRPGLQAVPRPAGPAPAAPPTPAAPPAPLPLVAADPRLEMLPTGRHDPPPPALPPPTPLHPPAPARPAPAHPWRRPLHPRARSA
jgi:hypothetical protein